MITRFGLMEMEGKMELNEENDDDDEMKRKDGKKESVKRIDRNFHAAFLLSVEWLVCWLISTGSNEYSAHCVKGSVPEG